ncbi:hypothetical protein BJX99DRAFT_238462 [Aspergillus californicus]
MTLPHSKRDTNLDALGIFCANHENCGQGLFCYKHMCIIDRPGHGLCRSNSQCNSSEKYCFLGECVIKKINPDSHITQPDVGTTTCQTDAECGGGACMNGICIAKRSSSSSNLRHVTRAPQSVDCHNDQECMGGYCNHGICVADPPYSLRVFDRSLQPVKSRSP